MKLRRFVIAACVCGIGAALAADPMPSHKAGLWEIVGTMGAEQGPPINEKVCLDASTEQLMLKAGAGINQKMCSKTDIHSTSSQIVVDTQCTLGSSKMTGHSVTNFTSNTSYHTDTSAHYDPPLFNRTDSKSSFNGKWVGACPADMKPGDMILSGGRMPKEMRMNLNDMLNRGS